MTIRPSSSQDPRAYPEAFFPSPPEGLPRANTTSFSPHWEDSPVPEIVNLQAKRLKQASFTSQELFNGISACLNKCALSDVDNNIPITKIAQCLRNEYEDLYNWVLQNGALARQMVADRCKPLRTKHLENDLHQVLSHVHLLALQQSEVKEYVFDLELNFCGKTDRLFSQAKPSTWNEIIGNECLAWSDVEKGFVAIFRKPLPNDREALYLEESHMQKIILNLSSLQHALYFRRPVVHDPLLLLVQHTFDQDQTTRTFPKCHGEFPEFFKMLDQCSSEFSLQTWLKNVSLRIEQLRNISSNFKKPEDSLLSEQKDRFLFHYRSDIRDFAIELLYDCLKVSLYIRYGWPDELKNAFKTALKKTTTLSRKELLIQIESDEQLRKTFLNHLSSEYLPKAPFRIILEKIVKLKESDFLELSTAQQRNPERTRFDILKEFLSSEPLPFGLISCKHWCQQ